MRPHPHRIPEVHWRRLSAEHRSQIDQYLNTLIYEQIKEQYKRACWRARLSYLYNFIPWPVAFALVASLISFLALALLPVRPLSMPVAMMIGLVAALYIQVCIKSIIA